MDSVDDSIPPVRAENKTSDGVRFLYERINHYGYVRFNEEDVARVMSEFGSSDPDFVMPLLHQIGKLGIKDKMWDPGIVKFAISFVRGIRPRDKIDALLGFHMMNVHQTILVNSARINQARFMQYNREEDDADRATTRLVQRFIQLAEAFDRRQHGAQKKVTGRPMAVANGHQPAKTGRPKRGTKNGNHVINGAADHVEVDDKILLNKSADVE
jgi:hypothetical protein